MPNDANVTYELDLDVVTEGDTSNPTVVEARLYQVRRGHEKSPAQFTSGLRFHVCNDGTYTNSTNGLIAVGTGYGSLRTAHTATKDITLDCPTAGAKAAGVLTLTGGASDVTDGETFVVGPQTYYISTGLTAVPASNVAVDVSADGTKSQGTISMATKPTATDTVVLGTKTYTFKAAAVVDGDVEIGALVANSQENLVAAINGTDGINTANTQVTAADFDSDASVVTAIYTGAQGDTIVASETFTDLTDAIDGSGNLGGTTAGVNPDETEAGDAIVTAVTGDTGAVVTAVNVAGVVTFTAKYNGAAYNAFSTTESTASGSFGAATLEDGVEDNIHVLRLELTDGVGQTHTLRVGPAVTGSLPVDFSQTLQITHA